MAGKRMFTMKICDSDAFLDMPLSAQCLYFHLNMRADDDGFIGNPKRVQRLIGSNEDDLKLLILKRFVLAFDDGVIVIKHWRMHNWMRNDRYTPTVYQEELKMLGMKENRAYTLDKSKCLPADTPKSTLNDTPNDSHNDSHNDTQSDKHCVIQEDCQMTPSDIDIDLDIDNTVSKDTVCSTDVQRFISAWNETGVNPVKKISRQTQRGKMLCSRIREYGIEAVLEAVSNISNSSFLRGQGRQGWTITLEWFVKPNNFIKVLENQYADKPAGNYSLDISHPGSEQPQLQGADCREEYDRFSSLDRQRRRELEKQGIIEEQTLVLGDATEEQIRYLQDCGVL